MKNRAKSRKRWCKQQLYFIQAISKRSGGVHVNEDVSSDIYFMYNYFEREKQTSQPKMEKKAYM